MAKKKKKRGKQGLTSWATSVFAMLIGLTPTFVAIGQAATGNDWRIFAHLMVKWYTGLHLNVSTLRYEGFEARDLAVGYGTMFGAIAFKKGMSHLVKSAKIQSIFPRIS